MLSIFEKQFDDLAIKIKFRWRYLVNRIIRYIKRILFPLYFFPVKLLTYSTYYLVKLTIRFFISLLKAILDFIKFPFSSLKNFLKSIFIIGIVAYMAASLFVIADYIRTQYGWYDKFFCSVETNENIYNSVVRVVGGYSEGSGFFIEPNQIITNFHVIADEPSPKIIFPDGSFITPVNIIGDRDADLAILFTKDEYPNLVMPLPDAYRLYDEETILAGGYPLGTDLTGRATVLRGRFIDYRNSSKMPAWYIQSDISLVEGMSGGPLVDQCGEVVGINTLSLAGLSLFIDGYWAQSIIPDFTDQNITKINVDPSLSPEDAVKAFYTYLKARRMEDGFALLSSKYLTETDYEEWTSRFTDILDVDVILTEQFEDTDDTAFVKFSTKNWNNGEVEIHYYEGTWQTVLEDGVYKMNDANIIEVDNPSFDWFFE